MPRVSPKEFFTKAKAEGLTKDEAARAWTDYSSGQSGMEPSANATPEPAQETENTPAPGVNPVAAALFPRANREGATKLQQGIGALADVSSLPGRLFSEGTKTLLHPGSASLKGLGDTKGDGIIDGLVRDPTLLPSFAVGGPATGLAAKAGLRGAAALLATGAAEGLTSAAGHQADRFSGGHGVDAGEFATEAALGTVLPAGLTGAGKVLKAPGQILKSLGKAGEEAIPEVLGTGRVVLPEPKFGIKLTPAQAARAKGDPANALQALEQFAETQPFLQGIPEELAEKNAGAAQDAILTTRNRVSGRPIATPEDIVPSVSGARMEDAVRTAKGEIGARAGRQQDLALMVSGANVTPVPAGKAGKAVDDYLESFGFSGKKGFRGQEGGISEGAINFALEQKELLANAKTTRQLLDQKRRIANQVYKGTSGLDPVFVGVDKSFLTGLERKVNDVITDQFDVALLANQLTNGEYVDAKKLWTAGNKGYSESRKILESVDKGLGLSSAKSTAEDYFSRVGEVGAEGLGKLKDAATRRNSDLAPVFREMQETFFDNLLKSSFSKGPNSNLVISPDKLATKWNAMDAGIKEVMIPKSVIDEMDALMGQISQSEAGSAKRLNPSGTSRLSMAIGVLKNPYEIVAGLLMRDPIKKYYTTGALGDLPSAVNILRAASKATRLTGQGLEGAASGVEKTINNPIGRAELRNQTRDEQGSLPNSLRR